MKVQDRPTTIYVRDIDEATSKNFSRLKKRYASNSNTEVVKRLINDFEGKEEELTECRTMFASIFRNRRCRILLQLIYVRINHHFGAGRSSFKFA
jgi:hypothetical protein